MMQIKTIENLIKAFMSFLFVRAFPNLIVIILIIIATFVIYVRVL